MAIECHFVRAAKDLASLHIYTGQCKRTGGCYNELVVAFFSTGGGVKARKSIPVDFMIYLQTCIYFICDDTWRTDHR